MYFSLGLWYVVVFSWSNFSFYSGKTSSRKAHSYIKYYIYTVHICIYICSNKNNSNINVFNSGVLLIEIVVFNWIKLNLLCVQFGCQLCSNRAVDVVDNQYTHSLAHIHAHSHTTRKLFMNFRLVVSLNVLIIGFILCRTRYCCCSRQQLSTYGLLACLAKHLQYSPTPLTNLLPPLPSIARPRANL